MSQLNLNLKSQQSYINLEKNSDIKDIYVVVDELELNKNNSINFFIKGQSDILTLNVDNDGDVSLFFKEYPDNIPEDAGRVNIPDTKRGIGSENYCYEDIYEIDNPKELKKDEWPGYVEFIFEYDNKDKWFEKIPDKEGYSKENKKIILEIKGFTKNQRVLTDIIHGEENLLPYGYNKIGLIHFWDTRDEEDLNENYPLAYSYITHLPNIESNQTSRKIEILNYDSAIENNSNRKFSLRIFGGQEDDVVLYYARLYAECDYLPINSGGE